MSKKLQNLVDELESKEKEDRKKLMEDPEFCKEFQRAIENELNKLN